MKRLGLLSGSILFVALLAIAVEAGAQTRRISTASGGTQSNDASFEPVVSSDGRVVAFTSRASNLVAGDTNGSADVFLHNRDNGQTVRVSLSNDGDQSNRESFAVAINADGSIVAFTSNASNLVDNDRNNAGDVFLRTPGSTIRVSLSLSGSDPNGASGQPSISGDGLKVAFTSSASNLVGADTNTAADIFVRDISTGAISRVSVATGGQQANGASDSPAISADGQIVVFRSDASNLVSNDTNLTSDIFVHNRATGVTSRVSVASGGSQAMGGSFDPVISGNGRAVAFVGHATNLVAGDTNSSADIFVHDLQTGATSRVSVSNTGTQGNSQSECPSLSSDGRFVVFDSTASNLVTSDVNAVVDVFLRDRATGETILLSVSNDGTQGDGMSSYPDVSGDGSVIVFDSFATNLVFDTNNVQDIFERRPILGALPGAPSNLSFQVDGTAVTLNWSAPTAGGPIDTYVLIVSAFGEEPFTVPVNTTATTFRAPSVPPGRYHVSVAAQNRVGLGPSSNEVYIGPPSAPRNLVANVSGFTVTLNWDRPASLVPVDAYVLSATPLGGARIDLPIGNVTSFSASTVPPGSYTVLVRGRNYFGLGDVSSSVTVQVGPLPCLTAPAAPTGLSLTQFGGEMFLMWNESQGCPATSYVLAVGSSAGSSDRAVVTLGNRTALQVELTATPPGRYFVRVYGVNQAGVSPASNELQVVVP